MTKTPRKLKIAAIKIASPGFIDLVDTQVAMALGASVQPFTKITPRTSVAVINRVGLDTRLSKNSLKDIVITYPHLFK